MAPVALISDVAEVPEQTEFAQGRTRDEFQQKIDREVGHLAENTAKAGWPAPHPGRLFGRYVVAKDDVAALKQVIRRAATLHKVGLLFYKDATTEAGHKVVKFHVKQKPVSD